MRLISYLEATGEERLGVERDGRTLPASALGPDAPRTMDELVAGGRHAVERLAALEASARDRFAAEGERPLRRLAPLRRPGKIVAVGLNYRSHAAETGQRLPDEPMLFAKFATAVIGEGDAIRWDPTLTDEVDYEAELAVVIGRRARRVPESAALEHVLGYTCLDDVTARDLQARDRQYVRSKSLDTFCPMGPVLVTADEIPDPQALAVRCEVNGEERQAASTADMIFPVARLVSFCSAAFTLEPGDVIATGTPAGVGLARRPPVFLRDGDEVAVEIERIGRLVNVCRTESA